MTKLWDYGNDALKLIVLSSIIFGTIYSGYCVLSNNFPGSINGNNFEIVEIIEGSSSRVKMVIAEQYNWNSGFREVTVYGENLVFTEGSWYTIIYRQTWLPGNWEIIRIRPSGATWGLQ